MSNEFVEAEVEPKKGWSLAPKSFRTKFILVVGAAVVFDLILSGSVALWNVNKLSRDASTEIKQGLENASKEYLDNYIQTTALRANLMFERVFSEVSALAAAQQNLIDHPEVQEQLGQAAAKTAQLRHNLIYDEKGNWSQNQKGESSVVSVWSYMLGPDKQPTPEVARQIQNSAMFDLFSGSLMATGSKKLQMYYMGPKQHPIMRTTPYLDQAQGFDTLYPGHNEKNFWDFFFPGVYESWQAWIKDPKKLADGNYVTGTAPYVDAITGNLIVTFFHPLWNKERTDCAGAVAVDITLEQLSGLINNVKVANTGFGFLTMSDGNVLAINAAGEKMLGLAIKNEDDSPGVTGLDRRLGKSIHPEVAALKMPLNKGPEISRIQINEGGKMEPYIVVLQRLADINLFNDKLEGENKIGKDHSTLGFVVPEREIYGTLYAAQKQITEATDRIRVWQLCLLIFSVAVVMTAVFGISKRITAGLIALAGAANQLQKKDYSVRVQIPAGDEIGQLGAVFNKMAHEIQNYTANLEGLVAERTEKLASANVEIQALNEQLKDENVRMGAELNVARRLQMMVLPKPEELKAIERLDIAGYMEPANEIGGDYYEVLKFGGRVKIGIGDVTGHGLESGVLMLMVQSVARTLLESGETDPKRFLDVLNGIICRNIERSGTNNNLTLSFIDYAENVVTLTGQHEEVIIVRNNGDVERVDTVDLGFPVGLEADISAFINTRELAFFPGDMIILYTDGITEAENPAGELFGIQRLCDSAQRHRAGDANKVKLGIVTDVMDYISTQKVHDDITLVVLKHL